MATFNIKSAGNPKLSYPVTDFSMRAEKVTEQPERWLLEFKVSGMPIPFREMVHTLEFNSQELGQLFAAFEAMLPVVQNADRLQEPPMTDPPD